MTTLVILREKKIGKIGIQDNVIQLLYNVSKNTLHTTGTFFLKIKDNAIQLLRNVGKNTLHTKGTFFFKR